MFFKLKEQRNEQSTPETRSSKRLKLDLTNTASTSAVKESPCIVCNQMKSKDDAKRMGFVKQI